MIDVVVVGDNTKESNINMPVRYGPFGGSKKKKLVNIHAVDILQSVVSIVENQKGTKVRLKNYNPMTSTVFQEKRYGAHSICCW